MRLTRIYTPQPLADQQSITLEEQASIHLCKVLRLSEGAPIQLFNGDGFSYSASLTKASKKSAVCTIESSDKPGNESNIRIDLCLSLAKGEKMEWIVQKATELGVHNIYPVIGDHSDIKLNAERFAKKQQQWQHIAISACEQSGRNIVPTVHTVTKLQDWASSSLDEQSQGLIFHTAGGDTLKQAATNFTAEHFTLCFGSEGGFSEHEVKYLGEKGFINITLGKRILRAETAPVAVMGALQTLLGDW